MVRSHRMIEAEGGTIPLARDVSPNKNESKTHKSNASVDIEFNFAELTDGQIHTLLHKLKDELHNRAMASDDPEVLGLEFLKALNGNTVEKPEALSKNYVGLGGIIKYNSAGTRHNCVLYSITMPGSDPFWAWEDNGTLAYAQSAKIADMRQSVAVHIAIDGMQFIRHTMKHDGEKHIRLSEDMWECSWSEDGEHLNIVKSKSVPRNLPIPNH